MRALQFPGRTFTIELSGEADLERLMELAEKEGLAIQARHPDLVPFTVNLGPVALDHLRTLAKDAGQEPENFLQGLVRAWLTEEHRRRRV